MREGQCFSCYIDAVFRYFGQTKEFWSTNYELEYINYYEKGLDKGDIIYCCTCGKKVRYEKRQNNKWYEVIL